VRRADRLFRLVQRLRRRGGEVTTAAQLAESLEVSERTVYRDVRDLILSGVPIRGEAGVGYALGKEFDLPPLMFDEDEIEALVLGSRIVSSWADAALAGAAQSVLSKVEAVLPERLRGRIAATATFALNFRGRRQGTGQLSLLRTAIRTRRKVALGYRDGKQAESRRHVRPLGLFYWSNAWSLGAWCELRQDFRNFRLDRIAAIELTEEAFAPEPGRTLEDFFAAMRAQGVLRVAAAEAARAPARRAPDRPSAERARPRGRRGGRGRATGTRPD
jgi:predicted DNA-binding transcriptional regulator YafY